MISQTLARRYAQALLALGREDGQYAAYGLELAAFTQVMENLDLGGALSNPILPKNTRRLILDRILEKLKLSKMTANFLVLLQDKGRIGHIQAINRTYQHLVDEVGNIQRATVVTAQAVDAKAQADLKATLEKLTGKTIVLETQVDPAIIGGVVARVGDLTLDGSIKTQLKNLKESLIKG